MSNQSKTLLIIGLFVALMIASFVWFVATWDPSKEEPVTWAFPAQEKTT
ncbi:hypothetical protein ACS3SW_14350 [Roseobacteraceae bacterium S113]